MKDGEEEIIDAEINIEVLDGREELLAAAAGTCTCSRRGPQIQILAMPEEAHTF